MRLLDLRPRPSAADLEQQRHRLLEEADRRGDADGRASPAEVRQLAETMRAQVSDFDGDRAERLRRLDALLGALPEGGVEELSPAVRALPTPLRRLALEVDALWGNADGTVSAAEFERLAGYYVAALPFFHREATDLLALATSLGLEAGGTVEALRSELGTLDPKEIGQAAPFRQMLDAALAQAEVPGAPELLREAAAHSPRWHELSVLEHTAWAVRAAKELAAAAGLDWTDAGATLLLHDVGKVLDREGTRPGAYNFEGHGRRGAEWLARKGAPEELVFSVRHHDLLRKMPEAEYLALLGPDPKRLARMVVLYLADQVAKGATPDQLDSLEQERPTIERFAKRAGLDPQALFARADALRAEVVAQAQRAHAVGVS